jgi:hypothetical protein
MGMLNQMNREITKGGDFAPSGVNLADFPLTFFSAAHYTESPSEAKVFARR